MEIGKLKLNKKTNNEKNLLEIIEEKELQIVEYKNKLELAKSEVSKLKSEVQLLREKVKGFIKEDSIDSSEEGVLNKGIETLTLGQATIGYEKYDSVEENNQKQVFELSEISLDVCIDESDTDKKNISEVITNENNIVEDSNVDKVNMTLMDDLKHSFIENNNYQCIEIINDILKDIRSVEENINDSDIIFLMYLGYFYEKLEGLLKESSAINEYYLKESKEVIVLKMLLQEKEYEMYKESNECIHSVIKKEKKLFNDLDTIIKVRIIDKINNVSYRSFDSVYSINDIEYGEETLSVKAWVKEKNGFVWRLVEGLYSSSKEKLYMLESSIYVLKLNINETVNKTFETKIVTKASKLENKNNITSSKKEKLVEQNEATKEELIEQNEISNENNNKWNSFKEKIVSRFKKSDE